MAWLDLMMAFQNKSYKEAFDFQQIGSRKYGLFHPLCNCAKTIQ